MNTGSQLVLSQFPEFDTARKVLSEVTPSDWIPTIPDGPYKSDGWRVIKIADKNGLTDFARKHPDIERVLAYFKCKIVMSVYYSMLPGAELHPHRDLSGTLELGRLRFHIPMETNPAVNFMVSKKRVPMKVGEMWALNTSYLHAVDNHGDTDRIHFVVEVEANDWCWSMLPKKTLKFYGHYAYFMTLIAVRAVTSTIKDPKALKRYSNMSRFLINRVLGRKPAER